MAEVKKCSHNLLSACCVIKMVKAQMLEQVHCHYLSQVCVFIRGEKLTSNLSHPQTPAAGEQSEAEVNVGLSCFTTVSPTPSQLFLKKTNSRSGINNLKGKSSTNPK